MRSALVTAIGCSDGGYLSHGPPTIYLDGASNVCYWSAPEDGSSLTYGQSLFAWYPDEGAPHQALHACNRPE